MRLNAQGVDKLIQEQLNSYLMKYNPEKLRFNPKIIDIIGNNILFKMNNHKGVFCVSIQGLGSSISEKEH